MCLMFCNAFNFTDVPYKVVTELTYKYILFTNSLTDIAHIQHFIYSLLVTWILIMFSFKFMSGHCPHVHNNSTEGTAHVSNVQVVI